MILMFALNTLIVRHQMEFNFERRRAPTHIQFEPKHANKNPNVCGAWPGELNWTATVISEHWRLSIGQFELGFFFVSTVRMMEHVKNLTILRAAIVMLLMNFTRKSISFKLKRTSNGISMGRRQQWWQQQQQSASEKKIRTDFVRSAWALNYAFFPHDSCSSRGERS